MPDELAARELLAVTPEAAADYLRATGWQLSSSHARSTSWRRLIGGDEVELLLPNNSGLRDYPVRMAELISSVAIIERRQRKDVLRSLQFPLLDVQYIRTNPDSPSGTTPLHDGYLAMRGIRDVFLAAATSVLLPRPVPVLPRNKPPAAWSFLKQAKLGQTSIGSYVIRIEIPVLAASPTTPDTRNVLLYLYNAVRSAQAAAIESSDGGSLAFESQVEHGVSASLCDALVDIGGPRRNEFVFSFAWAPQRPAPSHTADIEFDRNLIALLKDGSAYLKTTVSARNASITGHIIELRRQHRGAVGLVVIEGSLQVDERRQPRMRVTVRLSVDQYELAVHAHRTGQSVLAIGKLRSSSRTQELIDVTAFNLVDRPAP